MTKKIVIILSLFLHTIVGITQASQTVFLEEEFSKPNLTAENVSAFEFRAKQKIYDFYNYVELISNKEYDEKLREYSMQSAVSLFNSSECLIEDSLVNGSVDQLVISGFFDSLFVSEFYKISAEVIELSLSNRLIKIGEEVYSGTISYTRILKCYDEFSQLSYSSEEKKSVDVTLTRKSKAFGEKNKYIWVVSLCDVKNDTGE